VLINDNKFELLANLHTEADLGEGCVPVGRQLGLLHIESSLSTCNVEAFFVAPKSGIVMEGSL